MKHILLSTLILIAVNLNAQVGVGTTNPAATLDVTGNAAAAASLDGIIAPRLTGDQLQAKTYALAQTGALVYVSAAATAPAGQAINVDAGGYYNFDGVVWQKLGEGSQDGDAWGVTNEDQTSAITRTGNVGIGVTTPLSSLDVQRGARSGTHPSNFPLYVTGNLGQNANGIEFRHNNGTQGIGFGYNSIYATGTNTNQSLNLFARGDNGIGIGRINNINAALAIGNNVGTGGSFDTWSDYQILLYQSGSTVRSYGLGIEGNTFAFNSDNTYDFKIDAIDRMVLNINGLAVTDNVTIGSAAPQNNYRLRIENTTTNNETGINPAVFINQGAETPANIGNGFGTGIWFNTRRGVPQNSTPSAQINTYVETGSQTVDDRHNMSFMVRDNDTQREVLSLRYNANVGIGVTLPTNKLEVAGNVRATSFISNTTTYADYVFEAYENGVSELNNQYKFNTLEDVAAYVKANNHLPGVKGIKELDKTEDGDYIVNITETAMSLLEKVEELFLHVIDQKKEIEALKDEVKELKTKS